MLETSGPGATAAESRLPALPALPAPGLLGPEETGVGLFVLATAEWETRGFEATGAELSVLADAVTEPCEPVRVDLLAASVQVPLEGFELAAVRRALAVPTEPEILPAVVTAGQEQADADRSPAEQAERAGSYYAADLERKPLEAFGRLRSLGSGKPHESPAV